jgi:tricorn protease-like protein
MFAAKVQGQQVHVYNVKTGGMKRAISCAGFKGVKYASVNGDFVSITGEDGKVRVFDINTGSLKRTL